MNTPSERKYISEYNEIESWEWKKTEIFEMKYYVLTKLNQMKFNMFWRFDIT